jgi:hypothetical protein
MYYLRALKLHCKGNHSEGMCSCEDVVVKGKEDGYNSRRRPWGVTHAFRGTRCGGNGTEEATRRNQRHRGANGWGDDTRTATGGADAEATNGEAKVEKNRRDSS